jgi:peptide-methionine (S)-S-oxide reductase
MKIRPHGFYTPFGAGFVDGADMSRITWGFGLLAVLTLAACYAYTSPPASHPEPASAGGPTPTTEPSTPQIMARAKLADFAAGCFWGSEATFRKVPGVLATEVGFEGGTTTNPTYSDVCTDKTGHAETVRVTYDPTQVTYQQLLNIFFENHDPTTGDHQGPDYGTQYHSVIFYHDENQKELAEAEKARRDASGEYVGPIVTRILPAKNFYRAEEYHQDYFEKQGENYVCHLGNGKKK